MVSSPTTFLSILDPHIINAVPSLLCRFEVGGVRVVNVVNSNVAPVLAGTGA